MALAALLVLAAPSWPATVDDVYISLAYARQWAETGSLTWTDGNRVEGYSNFLFVCLLAAGIRLGLDADVLAQVISLAAGGAIITLLHHRLPRSAMATVALMAAAAWSPLAYWSGIGMETTFYALLLAMGWSAALDDRRHPGWSLSWLAAAALTRPEGHAHLVLGLVLVVSRKRPSSPWALAIPLGALAAYHAVRFVWFGALLPTSFLVKVAPVGPTRFGLAQLGGDLVTVTGLAIALVLAGSVKRTGLLWTVAPLAVQATVLVIASGDWMSHGRLVMPGVLASVAAYASALRPRNNVGLGALVLAGGLCVSGAAVTPIGYGTAILQRRSGSELLRFSDHFARGLDTPVAEDVAWVIDNVPSGDAGLVVDAGILGDIPGFTLVDMRGLNHRAMAEAVAAGTEETYLQTLVGSAKRPEFLRLANWGGGTHPDYPEWLLAPYPLRADLRYGGGSIRWHASTTASPSPTERASRWDEVLRRHPSHPFLHWRAALSAADTGNLETARAIAERARVRWPQMGWFSDAPGSLGLVRSEWELLWAGRDGFRLVCGQTAASRLIQPGEGLRLSWTAAAAMAELKLSDPCTSASLPPRGESMVPACSFGRQLAFELDCRGANRGDAHLRLD